MRILTRYLIRSHAGPFAFAFTLFTGMLFVNTVAQGLDELVGKGLPLRVIAEALLLSLPHTIAVTLPMAVLVAVLYTATELASASEIIAMSASGVQPRSLILPTVLMGALMGTVTYVFNDQILPAANHRLKNLQSSIHAKSPTFNLRARAVNRIEAEDGLGPYFLKAAVIDPAASELTDVVIYDMSRPGFRRTTYAARGEMSLNASLTNLHLRLHEGRTFEVGNGELGSFQQTEFKEQLYVLRGIGDVFESYHSDQRSDREMSVAMLRNAVHETLTELDSVRQESRERTLETVERAVGLDPTWDSLRNAAPRFSDGAPRLPPDDLTQGASISARTHAVRADALRKRANQYRVEIHKKFVIPTACIVFVLFGLPAGVRFPRGGVGLVIFVSTAVLAVYQVVLTDGEALADRNLVHPFWAMWTPNLVFFAVGVFMVSRMGRWIASVRGGDWREIGHAIGRLFRSSIRNRKRMT